VLLIATIKAQFAVRLVLAPLGLWVSQPILVGLGLGDFAPVVAWDFAIVALD
jgi:hypothetical protein